MEIFTDERIKRVVDLIRDSIKGSNFENKCFITGGAVRDSILSRPISDIDITVEIPNGGMMLATYLAVKNKCYTLDKNPCIYENYGVAKFQFLNDDELKDIVIECVETRKSLSLHGTLEEDAKRRDLTINALMYNISKGTLIDYNATAFSDMASQILRTPSNPNKIFAEDPIKILRVIRYATMFEWGIEKNTWLAMLENARFIKTVAKEKIVIELSKILTCVKPSIGIRKMYYCGILHRILPDIYDTVYAYESKNPLITTFDHTMDVLDEVQPQLESRLAALFHDVGKIVAERRKDIMLDKFSAEITAADLKMMKFSNRIINSVETAIKYHRAFSQYADGVLPPDKKIRKFLNLTREDFDTTLDLMNANNRHCAYGKKKRQVLDILNRMEELEDAEKAANVKLPINGSDIIKEFNLRPSPNVGILLEEVKEAYFENPEMTKDEAFAVVEKKLRSLIV